MSSAASAMSRSAKTESRTDGIPVADHRAHVLEHVGELGDQGGSGRRVRLPVGLDADPGLDDVLLLRRGGWDQVEEAAVFVAARGQPRMGDRVDSPTEPGEGGGDAVDQERHVVGDHLHGRVQRAGARGGPVDRPDHGPPRRSPEPGSQVRGDSGGQVVGRALRELAGRVRGRPLVEQQLGRGRGAQAGGRG